MESDENVDAARQRLERLQAFAGRRRANIANLRAQIEVYAEEVKPPAQRQAAVPSSDLETDRGKPSFVLSLRMHRRHGATGVNAEESFREPIDEFDAKMVANQFADLHGIQVPRLLGTWANPDEVDWNQLPDSFVLKSERGGGAVNVYPLERDGARYVDRLTGDPTTQETVTADLWSRYRPDARYYAEEMLTTPEGAPVPPDVKAFCFYGEVGFIEVRAGWSSRAKPTKRPARLFDSDGSELVNARALFPSQGGLDAPRDISAVVSACSTLSRAIRRPVQRLDFYESDHGVVFGEVTKNSGRPPALVPEWDEKFGQMYEDAYARLLTDVVAEGGLRLVYGGK